MRFNVCSDPDKERDPEKTDPALKHAYLSVWKYHVQFTVQLLLQPLRPIFPYSVFANCNMDMSVHFCQEHQTRNQDFTVKYDVSHTLKNQTLETGFCGAWTL
ncbi:UNVERIFIED_CONTAM: hypothetical protein K2H54_055940 [Gekko kuhli]